MTAPRQHVVSRPREIAALRSPARQEIVDVLSRMPRASAADLAATLGRPADGLYYHLRALERAGLVLRAGDRARGRRSEALYRTAAPELALRYASPGGKTAAAAVGAVVTSMLRLGIRDFRRALASGALVEGPRRELWALRTTGWLSPAGVGRVNRKILDLKDAVSEPRGGGRLYGITILLTPLDHRARKSRSRTRRKARK